MRYVRNVACMAILVLTCSIFAMGDNPIQTENALTGTTDWKIAPTSAAINHEVEGYASATSVNVGETIYFHLRVANTSEPLYFKIYRLGWYDGDGARQWYPTGTLAETGVEVTVEARAFPIPDSVTGLAECDWPSPTGANWTVPSTAVSGVYLIKLTSDGLSSYISFVVRNDSQESDVLFQRSVTTDQAYNNYPGQLYSPSSDYRNGKSLYNSNSYGTFLSLDFPHQARKVSFNRPYGVLSNSYYWGDDIGPQTIGDFTGPFSVGDGVYQTAGGTLFSFDYEMIRWLEHSGYDVTYCTNIDTQTADSTNGRLSAGRHKAFLSVGHDEYWSWEMRDNVEQARNRTSLPLNLGFFSGNTCYWQIRFEDSSSASVPASTSNRTIVSYKENARNLDPADADPLFSDTDNSNNHLISGRWVENLDTRDPLSKAPEDELVGVMSGYPAVLANGSNPAVISNDCPAWITAGTSGGPLNDMVGYEADFHPTGHNYPGQVLNIVADSPFVNNLNTDPNVVTETKGNANMTFYSLFSNNAHVFATGSMQWLHGLDDFSRNSASTPYWGGSSLVNSDARQITSNVLGCLININTQCGVAYAPPDLAVWRPATNSTWYVMAPGGTTQVSASWGTTGDIPVPGDFDGDGKTDFCVFRPSDHTWYLIYSSTNGVAGISFGASGDLVAPADYDGDGKTDIAVFRPSTGYWYILQSSNSGLTGGPWGASGDIPASADYDGDELADLTVWRDSNHTFYTIRSSDSSTQSASFGASGYQPIPGDYDGDGEADYALFQSA